MSFIRSKTIKGQSYLYEQESKREGNKVASKHLRYIGTGVAQSQASINREFSHLKGDIDSKKLQQIKDITRARRIIFSDPERKLNVKAYEKLFKKGYTTQEIWFDKSTGRYKSEREELHNKILNEIFSDSNKGKPKYDEKPTIILLGGPPGSGKTARILKTFDTSNYIILNNDDFKAKLPEYKGTNASLLHDEADDIFKQAIKSAAKEKKNIVLDATLKSSDKAKTMIQEFKERGYNVKLYATNITSKTSIERATSRFIKEGRYVPLDYISKNTDKINKSVKELTKYVDEYKVYDTDVGREQPAKLIMAGDNTRKLGTTVRGIIKKGDKYLLVQRNIKDKGGGQWQFVGGGVENNKFIDSLKREIREETNLDVTRPPKEITSIYNDDINTFTKYYDVAVDGDIKLQEEELQDYKWVTKDQMKGLELTPGAKKIYNDIL